MAFTICIDAGHYGRYNQSPVVPVYYESVMVWKLSQYQKEYLQQYKDVTVVMTRSSQEKDLDLFARGQKSKGADLFISNHSNAESSGKATYALAIVMRENTRVQYDDVSQDVGDRLVKVIGQVMGVSPKSITKEYVGDRDGNGLQDDEWYGVLQGAKMVGTPGIILEHGFHTHKETANWLMEDTNLKKLAKAEVEEIAEIFGLKKKKAADKETVAIKEKKGHIKIVYKGSDGLNIRKAPDFDSEVVRVVKKNSVINVVGITVDGVFYKTEDGNYVSANSLYSRFTAFTTYKVKVTYTDLNMRENPGVSSNGMGKIKPGTYTIVAEKDAPIDSSGTVGKWGKLKTNGYWIALKYAKRK